MATKVTTTVTASAIQRAARLAVDGIDGELRGDLAAKTEALDSAALGVG